MDPLQKVKIVTKKKQSDSPYKLTVMYSRTAEHKTHVTRILTPQTKKIKKKKACFRSMYSTPNSSTDQPAGWFDLSAGHRRDVRLRVEA